MLRHVAAKALRAHAQLVRPVAVGAATTNRGIFSAPPAMQNEGERTQVSTKDSEIATDTQSST